MNRMNVKHKKELALMSIAGICVIVSGILNIMVSLMGTAALKQDKASDRENSLQQKNISESGEFRENATFADIHIGRNTKAAAQSGQASVQNEDEYLCPEAVGRVLDKEDVERLKNAVYENLPQGKSIIQMVINEIYARNGYRFDSPELQEYFEAKSWYVPTANSDADMESIYAGMSETDKANLDMLKDERQGSKVQGEG